MSMITCAECGASASNSARRCPSCGAPPKRMRPKPPASRRLKITAAVLAVALVVGFTLQQRNQPQQTPEQVAAAAAEKQRDQAAYFGAQALKHGLRDPSSLQFDSIAVSEDGSAVCMRYRARNGFGGLNLEQMLLVDGETQTAHAAWKKHCTHAGMYDLTGIGHLIN